MCCLRWRMCEHPPSEFETRFRFQCLPETTALSMPSTRRRTKCSREPASFHPLAKDQCARPPSLGGTSALALARRRFVLLGAATSLRIVPILGCLTMVRCARTVDRGLRRKNPIGLATDLVMRLSSLLRGLDIAPTAGIPTCRALVTRFIDREPSPARQRLRPRAAPHISVRRRPIDRDAARAGGSPDLAA